ncbi:unnamed protein product [Brugia pahangi]|uniref:Phage protein n=1 Tax=Brugia pahangi TaxID=6280 RepID=A0A0N4TY34_BRUPA|nr:unnamed protein product [Brugia pahangi]
MQVNDDQMTVLIVVQQADDRYTQVGNVNKWGKCDIVGMTSERVSATKYFTFSRLVVSFTATEGDRIS